MKNDHKGYLKSLDLDSSEARANISCRDYCDAYMLQYNGMDGWEVELGTPFKSFCYSAVIDATGEEYGHRMECMAFDLHSHLDPDGKDAQITVAEAGAIALSREAREE